MTHRSIAISTVAVVAGALALSACGSSTSTTAAAGAGGSTSIAGQTITLYNGQHEQTTDAIVTAFEKQTGVKVKIRSDDEDVLTQQIEQEGPASPADVIYTENSPPLARLDEQHLLAPVSAGALASVPAADNAADGNWVGVSARVSALVYNTSDLTTAELPTSVLDLADPKWKGKLDIAPSETDFQPIVTAIAADKGQAAAIAFLKAIKSNAGSNKGVTQLGLVNSYYWLRLKQEVGASGMHSALHYFAPGDDGYLKDVSGVAVLASSKHQAAAQALVAFMTSQAGETVLASGDSYEYPVGSMVAANPALTPLATLSPKQFSLSQIGDGKAALMLLQTAGLV